jgi:UDPglucose--hexose-1-phosphate uridylyltransferase
VQSSIVYPRGNLKIETLLRVWQSQYVDLGSRPEIAHVLIFENKGEVVGVSNPHPHCQIYATTFVFKTIETEAIVSQRHFAETGRALFQDILAAERQEEQRIIRPSPSFPTLPVMLMRCLPRPKQRIQV